MYGSSLEGMFAGVLVIAALVGATIMGVLFWVIPWLWSLIKPWLHVVTG